MSVWIMSLNFSLLTISLKELWIYIKTCSVSEIVLQEAQFLLSYALIRSFNTKLEVTVVM